MEQNIQIPNDVLTIPAGPDGNGFLVEGIGVVATSVVGSDGNIYMRKGGKTFIAPEDMDIEP